MRSRAVDAARRSRRSRGANHTERARGGPVLILGKAHEGEDMKGRGLDHFEVFGLPRRLGIDTAELQRKRYEQEEARLRGRLSQAWDSAGPADRAGALTAFKESLAVRAFLRTVIDDIDEALGGSPEGYVSHRRH